MAENLRWDHTMINVNSIDAAIKWFNDLGIKFQRGGKHEQWGTENAVGYLGLNYIELISIFDQDLAKTVNRDDATSVYDAIHDLPEEHINTIGIRTQDIDQVHERLQSQNFPVGPIQTGKRLDPEGKMITWKIFFIRNKYFDVPYPFILQWEKPDYLRKKDLINQKLLDEHSDRHIMVSQAIYSVTNPEIIAVKWGQLLNITPVRKHDEWILDMGIRQLVFKSGQDNRITDLKFVKSGDLKDKEFKLGEANLQFE
ncbi:VOC family protein [Companilactobacillus mishanensis]|uniref:VOC family protein n=1 Tax=Companilactobacillus mishanensis TaxID=2486008 RepID=UPI00129769B2|nr:VOC family protein [Companilactobacillus mishanensis]MQS89927.1 VOC family protein [Companilactobacillus mishanensis]